MMNEDCCKPLMESAALTKHCTKSDVTTSLCDFETINQPEVTELHRENFNLAPATRAQRFLIVAYIRTYCTLDLTYGYLILCWSAAADLLIIGILKAFHSRRLATAHAELAHLPPHGKHK